MVSKLILDENDHGEKDEWGVMMPPRTRDGYSGEMPSPTFRYCNGRVTTVPAEKGHQWHRSSWNMDGGIISGYNQLPNSDIIQPTYFTPYQTITVFRGWKFRPVVFMGRDATVHNVNKDYFERCESVTQ